MNKRLILWLLALLLACTLTSCALLREPWPASEGYEIAALNDLTKPSLLAARKQRLCLPANPLPSRTTTADKEAAQC